MEDSSVDRFREVQLKIRRIRDRFKKLDALLKELERYAGEPERNAFVLKEKLRAFDKTTSDLRDSGELLPLLTGLSSDLSSRAEEAFQRAKSAVASDLARILESKGHKLSGNFPKLSSGILTLDFSFEAGGKVTVYFGPGIERMKQVPINVESITEAIFSIYAELDGSGFDEAAYLKLLFGAYRNALRLQGAEPGVPVLLSEVMLQTALLKQGKKFLIDPVKGSFSSYGRVRFAYDLSRIQTRVIDGYQLHLTVASMEQTKHPESHLWIPRGPRENKGTHFSTLAFRRAER